MRVLGALAEAQLAAAEHLRPGLELDVDLQADDGLVAQRTRRAPVEADRLLERVRGVEDAVLAERRAGELEAGRQALAEPVRDRDRRDAGEAHRHRAVVVEVHRQRVGGLGAELEGDAGRGRRDDEVEARERLVEVVGDHRADLLRLP